MTDPKKRNGAHDYGWEDALSDLAAENWTGHPCFAGEQSRQESECHTLKEKPDGKENADGKEAAGDTKVPDHSSCDEQNLLKESECHTLKWTLVDTEKNAVGDESSGQTEISGYSKSKEMLSKDGLSNLQNVSVESTFEWTPIN